MSKPLFDALRLLFVSLMLIGGSAARASDTIIVGAAGAPNALRWPLYIGIQKGFFEAANLKLDIIVAQSNAAVVQQLAAGSTNVITPSGLVDPIRAIVRGAPVAIVRIDIDGAPHALMAKPAFKRLADLKGKTLSVGGAKDITRVYTERVLATAGIKPGEFDMVFAGATSARFSALQAGAVDAAILTMPFNFYAESAGFNNVGFIFDHVTGFPFAGMAVNRNWATANPKLVERFLAVTNRSIAWFHDERNRDEAIKIMVDESRLKIDDVRRSYELLRDKRFFEPTGIVSKAQLASVVQVLREWGDIVGDFAIERLILPGVTQVSD